MTSSCPRERHTQLAKIMSHPSDENEQSAGHIGDVSCRFTEARPSGALGNFLSYYRGRRDFLASRRNEFDKAPYYHQLHNIEETPSFFYCSSVGWNSPTYMHAHASSAKGREAAGENRGGTPVVDVSLLYDLDWRLGSIAEFDKEIFAGKKVLDLGCNTGRISLIVASLLQPRSVLGVDIDSTLVCRARAELCQLERWYAQRQGRAQNPPCGRVVSKTARDCGSNVYWENIAAKACNIQNDAPASEHFLLRRAKRKLPYDSSKSSSPSVDGSYTSSPPVNGGRTENCKLLSGCKGSARSGEFTRVDASNSLTLAPGNSPHQDVMGTTLSHESKNMFVDAKAASAEREEVLQGGPSSYCGLVKQQNKVPSVPFKELPEKKICTKAAAPYTDLSFVRKGCAGRSVGDALHDQVRESALRPKRATTHSQPHPNSKIAAAERSTTQSPAHPGSNGAASECSTTHFPSHPGRNLAAVCEGGFPYNVSFCVADALGDRPWLLPAICENTCCSERNSASCFCGIISGLREQQAQLTSDKTKILWKSEAGTFVEYSVRKRKHVKKAVHAKHASFEWDKLEKTFDVVICFSLTKWIHLHHGDNGIILLFSRLHALLKDGGLLLLEPQDWASYRRARRRSFLFKNQLKSIRLCPRMFCCVLTGNRLCSCSGRIIPCKGGHPGIENDRVDLEESGRTYSVCSSSFKAIKATLSPVPTHACPFGLLAMLHPWKDFKRRKAGFLVKEKSARGSCPDISALEFESALHSFLHAGVRRASSLNTKKLLSERARTEREGEGTHSHTLTPVGKEKISSGGNQVDFWKQWQTGKYEVDHCAVAAPQVEMLQTGSDVDQTFTTKLRSGERITPSNVKQELTVHSRRQRTFVVNGRNSKTSDQAYSVRAVSDQCNKAVSDKRSEKQHGGTDNPQYNFWPEAGHCQSGLGRRESGKGVWRSNLGHTCSPFELSRKGVPADEDATATPAMKQTLSSMQALCKNRKAHIDAVGENMESVLFGPSNTREKQDIIEEIQVPETKLISKSEGTVGDRFVYVLQKLSTDFTLCCKQLQACIHPKAACDVLRVVDTPITPEQTL